MSIELRISQAWIDPQAAAAWPKLSASTRAAILRIVHEHTHQAQDGRQTP